MKITLKRNEEHLELLKAMASTNREVSYDACVALAEFLGPVLAEVINNALTLSNLFQTLQYNKQDNPSIPLDLYADVFDEKYITVYSQSVAGGLPTNTVQPTAAELKFATYSLDSAISFDKKYAAKSRLDVVGKSFTRMAQEILLKQERTSANLIMGALANAITGGAGDSYKHVFRTAQKGRLLLDDINKLFTKIKRINSSFVGGTPAGSRRGLTDLILSPEMVESLRSMAYNPITTKGPNGVSAPAAGDGAGLPAPDSVRNTIFSQAGIPEFFGVSIMEINELGIGQRFNTVFGVQAGSTTYAGHATGSPTTSNAFTAASEEIIIALDRSRDSLIRPVAVDADKGSEFALVADDSYNIRQQKIGWYGSVEEGRVVLDSRALVGLIA